MPDDPTRRVLDRDAARDAARDPLSDPLAQWRVWRVTRTPDPDVV